MNRDTGEIKKFEKGEEISDDYVRVYEEQMTAKQKANMQVSKHDSISELGKLFTGNRKERRRQAKEYKRKK